MNARFVVVMGAMATVLAVKANDTGFTGTFDNEAVPKIWEQWLQGAEPEAKEMVEKIKAVVADWEKTKK